MALIYRNYKLKRAAEMNKLANEKLSADYDCAKEEDVDNNHDSSFLQCTAHSRRLEGCKECMAVQTLLSISQSCVAPTQLPVAVVRPNTTSMTCPPPPASAHKNTETDRLPRTNKSSIWRQDTLSDKERAEYLFNNYLEELSDRCYHEGVDTSRLAKLLVSDKLKLEAVKSHECLEQPAFEDSMNIESYRDRETTSEEKHKSNLPIIVSHRRASAMPGSSPLVTSRAKGVKEMSVSRGFQINRPLDANPSNYEFTNVFESCYEKSDREKYLSLSAPMKFLNSYSSPHDNDETKEKRNSIEARDCLADGQIISPNSNIRSPPSRTSGCTILRAALQGMTIPVSHDYLQTSSSCSLAIGSPYMSTNNRLIASNTNISSMNKMQSCENSTDQSTISRPLETVSEPLDMRLTNRFSPGVAQVMSTEKQDNVFSRSPEIKVSSGVKRSLENEDILVGKKMKPAYSDQLNFTALRMPQKLCSNTSSEVSVPTSSPFNHLDLQSTPSVSLSSVFNFPCTLSASQISASSSCSFVPTSAPIVFTSINGMLVPISAAPTIQVIVVNNFSSTKQIFDHHALNGATALDTDTRLRPLAPAPMSTYTPCGSQDIRREPLTTLNDASPQRMVPENRNKMYRCDNPDCGKTYFKNSHLKVHQRIHTGEKPFSCTWSGCDKKFARSDELARHRRTHTGEKKYECAICLRQFMRSDHLTKHSRRHTSCTKRTNTVVFPCVGDAVLEQ